MHQIIAIITKADDQAEAIDNAKELFRTEIKEKSTGYDYCIPYDDDIEDTSGMETKWEPSLVRSVNGKKIIEFIFDAQMDDKLESLKKVREELAMYSNEDICNGDKTGMLTYNMQFVGAYNGPSIRLYCEDFFEVRTREDLRVVMENITYYDWIVPMDSHF